MINTNIGLQIPKSTAVEQSLLECGVWNQKAEQKLWGLRETLSSFQGAGLAGWLPGFYELCRMGGSQTGLRLGLGCSLWFPEGGSPRRLSPVVSNSPRPVNSIMCPLENVWPIALWERGKAEKEKLVFGSSRMSLINCSGLLIKWEGKMVGGTVRQILHARTSHTHTNTKPYTCLDAFV